MFTWMKLRPLALLGTLVFAGVAPAQTDRSGWHAELSTLAHDVRGVVTVVDSDTIRVDNFYYDGNGIEVYFYLGTADSQAAFTNGLQIGIDLVGPPFMNASMVIDLPAGESTDDYKAVSVWCVAANANFGSGKFEHPRTGWQADLVTKGHGVDGIVTIVDHNTIRLDEFDYDGGGFEVYVILAQEDTNSSIASGLRVSPDIFGTAYNNATLTFDLPMGETVNGYDAVGVWCVVAGQNFGSGSFNSVFEVDVATMQAGRPAIFSYSGATPERPLLTAYSLAGAGPSNTAIGMVSLSQPIRRLQNTVATYNGGGRLNVPIPSGTAGASIWMQAYDTGSARLSNGLMRVIQ
jgi:electron transfer DM13